MIDRERALAHIRAHFNEGADARRSFAEHASEKVFEAASLIAASMKSGGKLLVCGNGGSAADSQHFATEFLCRLTKDFERPGLPAIALTTDTSFLTAYPNDYEFAGVFERQVQALGKSGDVLFGISTSGSSENVIRAMKAAKVSGVKTVALCGEKGPLLELADVAIAVPCPKSQLVQEIHLAVEHLICHLVERALFPK